MAVTKSSIKAMKCPTHYAGYYLTPGAVVREIDSAMGRAGTEFHRYRQEYTDHLVNTNQVQDHEWVVAWLQTASISSDARRLIVGDALYAIDPDRVVGCEIFLSVDRQFKPLEMLTGRPPGQVSADPRALASGTIDRLEMAGREAVVTDWKSGWSTSNVQDHEPYIYAALVMSHFPQVDVVHYKWEFPRVRAEKEGGTYTRADLQWIQSFICGEDYRDQELRAKHAAGDKLGVDPWAGLCAFCALQCPLRKTATNERLLIPPVQNEADARAVGAVMFAAEMVLGLARQAVRPWLEARGKSLKLAEDYEMDVNVTARAEYPLPDTLALLGITIDEDALPKAEKGIKSGQAITPRWDVPIHSLLVSASKLHSLADTQKRRGMRDELEAVARRKIMSKVRIRKLNESDRLLEEEGDSVAME